MHPPVVLGHLIGQAKRHEIGNTNGSKDHGEKRQGRGLGFKAANVGLESVAELVWWWMDDADKHYQSHGLAEHIYHGLVCDSAGVGEEEEAQGDMEEGDGGDDSFC